MLAGRPYLLCGGRLLTADAVPSRADILVSSDGKIERIGLDLEGAVERIELSGALVSAAFVDCHQHLDKTGVLKFAPNPSGTLQGARDAFAGYARFAPADDIILRATRTMARCLSRGTTAIRTHINVDKDAGFRGIEAMAALRQQWSDRMVLQLVAFLIPHPNQDLEWLEDNIDSAVAMADAVGGTPAVSEDPNRYLDILFASAARHGRPLDLHMDEHLDASRHLFEAVFDRVEKYNMQGRTVLSHSSVLSAVPRKAFERIREHMLELDIGVVTLPAANLYLQGRDQDVLPPRGLTRVADLVRGKVPLATASDNIQDPFVPTGSGDMLEVGRWTLLAGHLHADDMAQVYAMITTVPARLMGLQNYGLREGARADLVITDCEDVIDLISRGPDRMLVMSRGQPVSERPGSSWHKADENITTRMGETR
ncbi:amidohydrolase family protein [Acidiphilium iwatense]|uniref:Amidohydrolase family protein n=2 Tax=Acidiphilium iwatense TaxID=768198 RepID=A0ABS9E0V9_9PROT|nr:amidohydrolase family protein [Acidiphilium iwatense]